MPDPKPSGLVGHPASEARPSGLLVMSSEVRKVRVGCEDKTPGQSALVLRDKRVELLSHHTYHNTITSLFLHITKVTEEKKIFFFCRHILKYLRVKRQVICNLLENTSAREKGTRQINVTFIMTKFG